MMAFVRHYKLIYNGDVWALKQQGCFADLTISPPEMADARRPAVSFHASLASAVDQDLHLTRMFEGKCPAQNARRFSKLK